ncbi:F0F1 ATP synthase subunit epsilon [Leeuwenhoekiella sp. A16]|uniref:F0F1 ATP synthase subunit epsilon n=1 Tax=unclassified Leeuwenhoekiella TaxID=2615029 RepID=UPI003A802A27
MHLEIVSPEATLFSGDVTSVTVPGTDGEFQMLDNHAPIVSLLEEGVVKIKGNITIKEKFKSKFTQGKEANEMLLKISSGTLEMKDNNAIILAD